ncbi:MAG: fluoride efflux transporter CrcB [Flavobacteriaceae bacterium]
MFKTLLIVGLGGGIGSMFRYLTSVLTDKYVQGTFPWATFLINIVGCLIIGILVGLLTKHQIENPQLKLFFITGFCGGFTTFSAFAFENLKLFQTGNSLLALLYIALSVILGILATWAGIMISVSE